MELDDYIAAHIDPEPPYLHSLWRDTQLRLSYGQMASGHVQGRLLRMLTLMIGPRLVVEIGTFSGYSALSIAEGLGEEGVIHTFEIYDEQEDFTRPWIEQSPLAHKIRFHIGDALTEVPRMGLRPDMAFVDGDKRHYVDYYEMLLRQMKSGGYIVADNTLWYGRVTEVPKASDLQTQGIQRFNDLVAHDERVERVIVPVRDGLTIIRIK